MLNLRHKKILQHPALLSVDCSTTIEFTIGKELFIMKPSNTRPLTEGSLYRHLCTLAFPLILGNILQQFYNTIDAFVIGRFAGTEEFAAIGIAGTVMNLFLFAIVGVCTGFSILLAKYYGAGDLKQFRKQHFTALFLGLLCTIILCIAGFLLLPWIMKLIQTPTELMPFVLSYLHIILLSLPASFLYNFYAALLRSVGNTRAALYVLAAAVSANLLLDLILVGSCFMGITGAAIATAITQAFSCLFCILYLIHSHKNLLFSRKDCELTKERILETLHFGSVTALHQSGLYIGKMLVQGAVNTGGTDLIAAYTAATRVESFANSFGDSGSAATSILTAQNYGAGKKDRVHQSFFCSLKLLASVGLICAALMFLTASRTAAFMLGSSSGAALQNTITYLKVIAAFYVFCFTGNTFAGYFDGIGKVSVPFLGAVSHITLRVILSWILIGTYQLKAVAVASGIGWMLVNLFWGMIFLSKSHRATTQISNAA